jgi:hypothetical protein
MKNWKGAGYSGAKIMPARRSKLKCQISDFTDGKLRIILFAEKLQGHRNQPGRIALPLSCRYADSQKFLCVGYREEFCPINCWFRALLR